MSMSVQTTFSSAPATAINGQPVGQDNDYITMKNVEASASIAFGRAVCFKLAAPASDLDALLPALETDTVAGIVVHTDTYARSWTSSDGTTFGDLDSTGLRPGAMMKIMRRGRIRVIVEDTVAVGDRLWVRCEAAEGDPEFVGGLNNADDGTEMIDCTKQGVWMTSATAGGFAELEFDFTIKP